MHHFLNQTKMLKLKKKNTESKNNSSSISKQEIVTIGVLLSTKKPNLDTYDKFCPKFLEYLIVTLLIKLNGLIGIKNPSHLTQIFS